MVFIILLKGIVIGFAMGIPIGPIAVMAIRKTLSDGRLYGMIIGLGASSADMVYSTIAAFGLTVLANTITSHKVYLRLIGGAILLFLGIRAFKARPKDPKIHEQNGNLVSLYISTFVLTLTNPMTIFAFAAVFAGLGLVNEPGRIYPSVLVAGVFIGSMIWYTLLVSGVIYFRNKLDINGLRWVNRIAGILLIASAFIAIGSLL